MIEVEHLSKWYGSTRAVADISFRVDKGEVVGFLGPNGAGKSTTLRILAGFLGASAGTVRIAGHDIVEEAMQAREKIGYMPELSPLYPEMRVREYLVFRAELKRIGRRARRDAVDRAMEQAKVADVQGVRIGHLSKGYRQRVGLADALVGAPALLILDEPTAGLDPNQIREVRSLIRTLGREHTVLLSTHILPEVEATCSRAVVIARGRLVAQGSIDEIRTMRRSPGVRIQARGHASSALAAVERVKGVRSAEMDSPVTDAGAAAESALFALSIAFDSAADGPKTTEEIVRALVGAKAGVREVSPHKVTLEQVFSELTIAPAASGDGRDGEPDSNRQAGRGPDSDRQAGRGPDSDRQREATASSGDAAAPGGDGEQDASPAADASPGSTRGGS